MCAPPKSGRNLRSILWKNDGEILVMSLKIFLIILLKSDISIDEFLLSKKIIKSISDVKLRSLTPILPKPNMKKFFKILRS